MRINWIETLKEWKCFCVDLVYKKKAAEQDKALDILVDAIQEIERLHDMFYPAQISEDILREFDLIYETLDLHPSEENEIDDFLDKQNLAHGG